MIDALIAGRLYGRVAERTSKNGSRFATTKVRVAVRDESFFVNVITFSASAVDALLTLGDGDSVALSGELTPKVWTDKHGQAKPSLDLLAHAVLTAYAVQRRRKAAKSADTPSTSPSSGQHSAPADGGAPFNDEIPF